MSKIRHPEKVNKPINPIKKKPTWIRSKILDSKIFFETLGLFFNVVESGPPDKIIPCALVIDKDFRISTSHGIISQ